MPPRVSVLMPVYNSEAYLAQTIESVLGQTYRDLELVLIDDASTDGSPAIMEAYARADSRVVLVRNETNLGAPGSLNRGLDLLRGEFIARQDSDDISLPQRLARQVAFMKAHPQVAVAGCQVGLINERGRSLGRALPYPLTDQGIRALALLHTPFSGPAVMVRRDVVQEHGLRFRPEMIFSEDYDMYSRLLAFGQGANLPEVLFFYRKRFGSVSHLHFDPQEDAADRISWANLEREDLAARFSPQEIGLLRSWDHRARSLGREDFQRRWRLLRRFLALIDQEFQLSAHDRRAVRSRLLAKLRHDIPFKSLDAGLLGLKARAMALDPWGALTEQALSVRLKARGLLGRL